MDLHIDKKIGLLLGIVFVLGGIIGGLVGVVAGSHRHEFREFGGRYGFSTMDAYRHEGNFGKEGGFSSRAGNRGAPLDGISPSDTHGTTLPVPASTTTKTN